MRLTTLAALLILSVKQPAGAGDMAAPSSPILLA